MYSHLLDNSPPVDLIQFQCWDLFAHLWQPNLSPSSSTELNFLVTLFFVRFRLPFMDVSLPAAFGEPSSSALSQLIESLINNLDQLRSIWHSKLLCAHPLFYLICGQLWTHLTQLVALCMPDSPRSLHLAVAYLIPAKALQLLYLLLLPLWQSLNLLHLLLYTWNPSNDAAPFCSLPSQPFFFTLANIDFIDSQYCTFFSLSSSLSKVSRLHYALLTIPPLIFGLLLVSSPIF